MVVFLRVLLNISPSHSRRHTTPFLDHRELHPNSSPQFVFQLCWTDILVNILVTCEVSNVFFCSLYCNISLFLSSAFGNVRMWGNLESDSFVFVCSQFLLKLGRYFLFCFGVIELGGLDSLFFLLWEHCKIIDWKYIFYFK